MEKVNDRVEAVNERMNPGRIMRRRTARVRNGMRNVRQSVMGAVDDIEPSQARDAVRDKAEGNPLLAGLVAFGGGLVLASALPPRESERQAAERLVQGLEPLREQAVSAGRSVAGELQQSAQVRAERLKQRASSAATRVKSEAQGSADEVKGRAGGATKRVQKRAQGSTKRVQKRAQGASTQVRKQARRSTGAAKSQGGPAARRTAKRSASST